MRWKGGFISNVYRSNTGLINLSTPENKTASSTLRGVQQQKGHT